MTRPLLPVHGGPDGGAAVTHDFSTNASPLGPPPLLWQAVQQADRRHYPDPQYRALRRRLGDAERVLPTAGGAIAAGYDRHALELRVSLGEDLEHISILDHRIALQAQRRLKHAHRL